MGFAMLLLPFLVSSQPLESWQTSELAVTTLKGQDGQLYHLQESLPLIDFQLDGSNCHSSSAGSWKQKLSIVFEEDPSILNGAAGTITFTNISADTVSLSNVVPFGQSPGKVYITGLGNHPLSRTHLFLPGRQPVNVIVPDNAWELGFSESVVKDSLFVCALTRRSRTNFKKGSLHRFETILYPGGAISYKIYADLYTGQWQNGLREIFQKRYLYDVKNFDDSLYNRKDLQWIRQSYVIHLLMAWDKQFYDDCDHSYHLADFLKKGKSLYGGDDVVGIWPTWPSLGIDQRNQFDLFRDLPGGLAQVRKLAATCHENNSHLFICYNPWDESTRSEGHLSGIADIIRETNADGTVLDTQGNSSRQLQAAADSVKDGVIMYPEGMAVPKDMQGVVAGQGSQRAVLSANAEFE